MVDVHAPGHQHPGQVLRQEAHGQHRQGEIAVALAKGYAAAQVEVFGHAGRERAQHGDGADVEHPGIAHAHDGAGIAGGFILILREPHGLEDERPLPPGGLEGMIHPQARRAVIIEHADLGVDHTLERDRARRGKVRDIAQVVDDAGHQHKEDHAEAVMRMRLSVKSCAARTRAFCPSSSPARSASSPQATLLTRYWR